MANSFPTTPTLYEPLQQSIGQILQGEFFKDAAESLNWSFANVGIMPQFQQWFDNTIQMDERGTTVLLGRVRVPVLSPVHNKYIPEIYADVDNATDGATITFTSTNGADAVTIAINNSTAPARVYVGSQLTLLASSAFGYTDEVVITMTPGPGVGTNNVTIYSISLTPVLPLSPLDVGIRPNIRPLENDRGVPDFANPNTYPGFEPFEIGADSLFEPGSPASALIPEIMGDDIRFLKAQPRVLMNIMGLASSYVSKTSFITEGTFSGTVRGGLNLGAMVNTFPVYERLPGLAGSPRLFSEIHVWALIARYPTGGVVVAPEDGRFRFCIGNQSISPDEGSNIYTESTLILTPPLPDDPTIPVFTWVGGSFQTKQDLDNLPIEGINFLGTTLVRPYDELSEYPNTIALTDCQCLSLVVWGV